jgi:hypothetical protein
MKKHIRAAVAYISGRRISSEESSSVFDYSQGKHIFMSGKVEIGKVEVFDFDSNCHISGNSSGSSYNLFHFGDSHHIQLKIDGDRFEGFDFGQSYHFNGRVNGKSVSFFDFEDGSWTNFNI